MIVFHLHMCVCVCVLRPLGILRTNTFKTLFEYGYNEKESYAIDDSFTTTYMTCFL